MRTGENLKNLRRRKGYTQENMASALHISKQLTSHIENGRRDMTEELARESALLFSDAQYGFEVARESASDYITPLTNGGRAVEWHRLALEEVFKKEANEAISCFDEVSLVKPPEYVNDDEKGHIEQGAQELLDVQMSINSFLVRLEQEYGISIDECMKQRMPQWKSEGLIV